MDQQRVIVLFRLTSPVFPVKKKRMWWTGGLGSVESRLSLGHPNPLRLTALTPRNVTLSHSGVVSP